MPYGFIGNACKTYLSNTNNAMLSAQAVNNRDPFGGSHGGSCPPPSIRVPCNQTLKNSPDSAMSGGYKTGLGNQSNVVVSEGAYAEILQKIRTTDSGIAEELYNIAVQIEEMCNTIYIVPATLPKYLAIVNKVKSSLGEFQSLAERTGIKAYEFMGEIVRIDGQAR